MEPARLRAILGRTPGLVARHLTPVTLPVRAAGESALPGDLLDRLLGGSLPERARRWLTHPDERLIDADLRWIEATRTRILTCLDADYPPLLRALQCAPALLHVRGTQPALAAPVVAIVGSPQATPAGQQTAGWFAGELARSGVGVLTVLDEGLATAAQEGALARAGRCAAVCTAGLDQPFGRLARLAARLCAEGCLVSPFGLGVPTQRHHFALRNRLVAALSMATLVVEAAPDSGALRTAAAAAGLQRRVFAVPGPIREPLARPCNALIRAGATLAQAPAELLSDLNIQFYQHVTQGLPALPAPSPLDNKYEMLLDAAGFEPVDIDALAVRTGWSGHAVAAMLLILELQGRVAPQPGGRYCRLS